MIPQDVDSHETQFERTRLSWQRTLFSLLTVVAIGAVRDIAIGHPYFGLVSALVALVMVIPMASRGHALHNRKLQTLTWQPIMLVLGTLVVAVGALYSFYDPV